MKKHKKLIIILFALVVLTGCVNYIDRDTGKIMVDKIIHWGDAWTWGKENWFEALFVWPMARILNFFGQYTGAFLAIVILALLVRLATLRSSINSTIQQQKMQLMGPEQQRIQEKYRNRTDQQSKMAMNTEIQKLYQKHDIKPLSALGGTFLQLPITFAMYYAVTRADVIIRGTVLGQSLEITPKDGFASGNVVVIAIFLLMIVAQASSMFLPQYMTRRKMKKYPGQKAPANNTNSMMFMSLAMIVFFALNWNIGMSLYWMISAFTQLGQTLFINWKYGNQ